MSVSFGVFCGFSPFSHTLEIVFPPSGCFSCSMWFPKSRAPPAELGAEPPQLWKFGNFGAFPQGKIKKFVGFGRSLMFGEDFGLRIDDFTPILGRFGAVGMGSVVASTSLLGLKMEFS